MRIVQSYDHEISRWPSGVKRQPETMSLCPLKMRLSRFWHCFHRMTLLSQDEVASSCPSGEKTMPEMGRVCAKKKLSRWCELHSQVASMPSRPPESHCLPSCDGAQAAM